MHRYLDAAAALVAPLKPREVLDVGCGEGHLLAHLRSAFPNARVLGVDAAPAAVDSASSSYSDMRFFTGSIYELPFADRAFDLVVCTDVLQILHDPQRALRQLHRVCARYALLSVPREPWSRLLNVARGAYARDFGNPPGHVQHYHRADFLNMVQGHFRVVKVALPIPWTVVLVRSVDDVNGG
jgi:ubiquinone/menaquinone biosynthesis C-methylase UbiE